MISMILKTGRRNNSVNLSEVSVTATASALQNFLYAQGITLS